MQNLDSVFAGAEKSTPNPFLTDVFAPGITDLPGVADIHSDVLSHCVKAFESLLRESRNASAPWGSSGRTILIAAPRAGYGKSHLVGRIRTVTESLVTAISLPFDPIRPISWNNVLESLMNQYRSARCPQNISCTLFDETARFFQSHCVRLAMEHGAVDSKEVPETEVAMRVQFRDVFDPKAGTKLTAWFGKRSPEIIDAAAGDLCRRWSMGFDDLAFWNRFFIDHTRPKADPFAQLREFSPAESRQRLTEFLRIATDCRPVAFVADHLDGFFGSEHAGMEIARILTAIREGVPRSVTLLCLNEDLWQSLFEGRIPSAWIDRLTGDAVPLKEITIVSAETMLQARLHAAGITGPGAAGFIHQFRERHGWNSGDPDAPIFPREVLREAARLWDEASASPSSTRTRFPTETQPAKPPLGAPKAPVDPQSPARQSPMPPTKTAQSPKLDLGARFIGANDAAAAARAAGKDVSRGPTDIESIIADIRGTGTRAVSEFARGGASPFRNKGDNRPRKGEPCVPPQRRSSADRNPFWAKNLEKRLQELESLSVTGTERVHWDPARIEHLIRSVGERFPAVGQTEHQIAGAQGGSCLRWIVKNDSVFLGFEPPSDLLFWKALLQLAESMGAHETRKITVLSHSSVPFDFRALAGIGTDHAAVLRFFDVIEIGDNDLRRLYAAERFLKEAEAADQADAAVRVIARRLDTFWRRLTRPLTSIEPAP